jgi:phospholipid/cholesterol/gamma-HCH transport system permease protein
LTLYGDLLGILGGGLIGVTVLGISPVEYFHQTSAALTLTACAQSLIKSAAYGMLVALAGCWPTNVRPQSRMRTASGPQGRSVRWR